MLEEVKLNNKATIFKYSNKDKCLIRKKLDELINDKPLYNAYCSYNQEMIKRNNAKILRVECEFIRIGVNEEGIKEMVNERITFYNIRGSSIVKKIEAIYPDYKIESLILNGFTDVGGLYNVQDIIKYLDLSYEAKLISESGLNKFISDIEDVNMRNLIKVIYQRQEYSNKEYLENYLRKYNQNE